jgi:hypothetical protein
MRGYRTPILFGLLFFAGMLGARQPDVAPDRAGLLAAFGRELGQGAEVEPAGPESWRIKSEAIGYQGEVVIDAALIRPQSSGAYSHTGVIEFRLPNLPAERSQSRPVQVWRAALENFYYREGRGWLPIRSLATEPPLQTDPERKLGQHRGESIRLLAWAADWGTPILALLILLWLFTTVARQVRLNREAQQATLKQNAAVFEHFERVRALFDEQAAQMRRSEELAQERNRLLAEILSALTALRRGA